MACFAKYHLDELPVYQALDNFYEQAEPDGFICREYRQDGRPLWPRDHPVSINPPLLAFAELEIYTVSKDVERLKSVYPKLKKNFEFQVDRYQGDDNPVFWGCPWNGNGQYPTLPKGLDANRGKRTNGGRAMVQDRCSEPTCGRAAGSFRRRIQGH